jgi:hypothetical protein
MGQASDYRKNSDFSRAYAIVKVIDHDPEGRQRAAQHRNALQPLEPFAGTAK